MLKRLWTTWTIDKPAALGDWLWDVFVVQFAVWLDRLTVRQVIAFIPVLILVLAYAHSIPIPPELMLVGDVLAYLDIFSVLFLLGVLSRVATIVFVLKKVTAHACELMEHAHEQMQRLDFRHRRASGARHRKRSDRLTGSEDDGYPVMRGVAWA